MTKPIAIKVLLPLLMVLLAFLGCTQGSKTAGGGTSTETTNGISGVLQNADGQIISAQKVYLLQFINANEPALLMDSTISDESGQFSFSDLAPGNYTIITGNTSATAWETTKINDDPSANISPVILQLKPVAVIRGTLNHPMLDIFPHEVLIKGSNWTTQADSSGDFMLTALPRDSLTLLVVLIHDSERSVLYAKDIVTSTDTLDLGTLEEFQLAETGDTLLIDDFENEDRQNLLKTNWWVFSDATKGGSTVVSGYPENSEYWVLEEDGNGAAGFTYTMDQEAPYYAGIGTNLGINFQGIISDFRGLQAVSLKVRGAGGNLQACLAASLLENHAPMCNTISPNSVIDWQELVIPWDTTALDSYSSTTWSASEYLQLIDMLDFIAFDEANASGEWFIDDVKLIF